MRDAVRRLRDHDEEGLSLVEIMVAAFILTVALLALASTATASLISLSTSLGRQMAMDAASAMIEDLRRTQFSALALDETRLGDLASTDCVDGEWIVKSGAPGALPRTQPSPFGEEGRVTVTTTITWYDPDADANTCARRTGDVKRVHVVAEWTDRGRGFTLEESTLVAAVDRGLPVPDFRVTPTEASIAFTRNELVADGSELCEPHVVRNLGAEDGYEWHAERIGSGSATKHTDNIQFRDANNLIRMRAIFEAPAGDEGSPEDFGLDWGAPNPAALPPSYELMTDQDGDGWPEAQRRLAPGDQARIWICYRVDKSASVGMEARYKITLRSRFDPNRTESVEHTVRVDAVTPKFYLFHDYEPDDPAAEPVEGAADSDRIRWRGGNQYYLPTWLMGPLGSTEPAVLWPYDFRLPNYDTDFTTHEGLRLADTTNWQAGTVRFHRHHAEETTYINGVTLTLWSAPESAPPGGDGSSLADDERVTLTYRVRLERLHTNEQNVQQVLLNTTVTYTHTTAGWQEVVMPFTGGGLAEFTVGANEFLRLELQCVPPPDLDPDPCHIAFDHERYPSNLKLEVK